MGQPSCENNKHGGMVFRLNRLKMIWKTEEGLQIHSPSIIPLYSFPDEKSSFLRCSFLFIFKLFLFFIFEGGEGILSMESGQDSIVHCVFHRKNYWVSPGTSRCQVQISNLSWGKKMGKKAISPFIKKASWLIKLSAVGYTRILVSKTNRTNL